MQYYHRAIEQELEKMMGVFPAIMVLGARQTGKSTLLAFLARQKEIKTEYVTLDNVVLAGEANEHPEQFLGTYGRPLTVDEFQYAPNLTSYMKIEIDQARQKALFGDGEPVETLFFLTGSQIFDSRDVVRESLAGRVGIVNLYTLSAREIEQVPERPFSPRMEDLKGRTPTAHLKEKEFYERILRGGYPELYAQEAVDTQQFYAAYLQTYIERDIRRQIRPENEYNFSRLLSLLAARTGQQLVVENVAAELGVDGKTVTKWLSTLEATGLVYLLRPYYNNATKRVAKKPKIYFMDTGLACYLAGYPTVEGLMNSSFKGQIFETYVVTEILKSFANAGRDIAKDVYYFRQKDKAESDLLLKIQDVYYPIEIKATDRPTVGDTAWFKELEKLGLKCGEGMVICRCGEKMSLGAEAWALPVEYI